MSTPESRGHDPEDVDRLFQEIVDGFEQEGRAERTSGDEGDDGEVARSREASPPPGISHHGLGTPPGMATDHRSYEPPEDPDEDHFIPPPTPPLPAGDLHFWGIVVGLVGGPFLLFISAVIPILSQTWAFVGALLLTAGFVLLVLRLPRHRNDDDWGAQV